mgnify:CR=1 FL=1
MTLFDTVFLAFIVLAFSAFWLVLFVAWLLVTVFPGKARKKSA